MRKCEISRVCERLQRSRPTWRTIERLGTLLAGGHNPAPAPRPCLATSLRATTTGLLPRAPVRQPELDRIQTDRARRGGNLLVAEPSAAESAPNLAHIAIDIRVISHSVASGSAPPPTKAKMPSLARNATQLSGLDNLGTTCYLNSLIQTMRFTPACRERLFELGMICKCITVESRRSAELDELGVIDGNAESPRVRAIPVQLQVHICDMH